MKARLVEFGDNTSCFGMAHSSSANKSLADGGIVVFMATDGIMCVQSDQTYLSLRPLSTFGHRRTVSES